MTNVHCREAAKVSPATGPAAAPDALQQQAEMGLLRQKAAEAEARAAEAETSGRRLQAEIEALQAKAVAARATTDLEMRLKQVQVCDSCRLLRFRAWNFLLVALLTTFCHDDFVGHRAALSQAVAARAHGRRKGRSTAASRARAGSRSLGEYCPPGSHGARNCQLCDRGL